MIKVGSQGNEVVAWQTFIRKFANSYAGHLRIDGYFGNDDLDVHQNWQYRMNLPITKGISDEELEIMGIKKGIQPTVPRDEKVLGLAFRGTGGIIGEDIVSRVFQAVSHLVEEINPMWPATMGGFPVGTAGNINDPSYWNGVQLAVRDAKRIVQEALTRNPKRKIIVGGYSAGAFVAAVIIQWLKENHPDNYLCSFSIGDPTRPFGASYYLGPILSGEGIASVHYGDPKDYRHCWLTDPEDMYGNVPLGKVGEIMHGAYDLITKIEMSNLLGNAKELLGVILEIMDDAGIGVPYLIRGATDGIPFSVVIPVLIKMIPGLIAGSGGNVNKLEGPAAAASAAVIALKFVAAGTRPHIEYHMREVWPGQTYQGLAIQHVKDYLGRAA